MPSEIINQCSQLIAAKEWNIGFAESATAGRVCSEFSLTPHSGKILRGGLCCYEIFVKEQILKVPHNMIEEFTPESAQVTATLARNAARFFNTKVTVALTGLTTPGGSETKEKPVGTMFFSILTPLGLIEERIVFSGSPEQIILQSADKVAQLILDQVNN